MANANDPQGIAAERIRLNAIVTARTAEIAAWTGDTNGLRDLQTQNNEASFRLNGLTTAGTNVLVNMAGTSFAGFGLEEMST